jgi:hypothetical protein
MSLSPRAATSARSCATDRENGSGAGGRSTTRANGTRILTQTIGVRTLCSQEKRPGLRKAPAKARSTISERGRMRRRSPCGRIAEPAPATRCGETRSGSQTRRDRTRIRTVIRRPISNGGLEYQLQLDSIQEEDHGYDRGGGVMQVFVSRVSCLRKVVCRSASSSKKS